MRIPVKSKVKSLLSNIGLYERLKCSTLYALYCSLANRKLIQEQRQELHFYRSVLPGIKPGDIIFDIGANVGHKTQLFLKLGCHVIAVEPDETNQNLLHQSFHIFRLKKKPVTIVGKAVSDRVGTQSLWVEEAGSALNTLSTKWVKSLQAEQQRFNHHVRFRQQRTVETTTIDELIQTYGHPYYIKIDVEGHEASVINGMNVPVPIVSFEVNLPEFRTEGLACIGRLERISPGGRFNLFQDCAQGLALAEWLPHAEFEARFTERPESCVEVIWRANAGERT
jgi:FkbM family methyltransferase